MAMSDRTDLLPVLIVLAMLGFVGSVSVSRYVSKSDSMTPGAEAGALSDFSNSDWHMPQEAKEEGPAEAAPASASVSTVDEVTRARSRRSIRTPMPPVRGWAPGPIRGPTTPSTGGRRPRTRKGRTMVLDIISAVLFFLGALLSLAAAV